MIMLWLFDCQRTFVNDVLTVKTANDVLTVINLLLIVVPLDPAHRAGLAGHAPVVEIQTSLA